MITESGKVSFMQINPMTGEYRATEMELDEFNVLVRQARSLEELRCLWFGFCDRPERLERKTRKNKSAIPAAAGKQ